jgi:hypothetical protein
MTLVACARPGLHRPAPVVALAPAAATAEAIDATLLLIGDAGDPGRNSAGRPEPVLRGAARVLGEASGRRAIVYLGDNVYDRGYPPVDVGASPASEEERRARAILDAQVSLAGDETGAVPNDVPRWFVPGNHDWNDRGGRAAPDGERRTRAQGDYLRRHAAAGATVELVPGDACPGPVVRDVGRWLRVVAIDTEWWLLDRALPDGACGGVNTRARAVARLRETLAGSGERRVIVFAHHPLATTGPHGANCAGLLECVGRPFRVALGWFAGRQDLSNRANQRMRAAVESALAARRPLVYAAGHEHALQVFRGGAADWYLVSGSGIHRHVDRVGCRRASTFAAAVGGFMRLDASADGRVRLTVYTVDEAGAVTARYRRWLTDAPNESGEGGNC